MANLLINRWVQVGVAVTVTAVVFTVIGVLIAGDGSVGSVSGTGAVAGAGEGEEGTAFVGLTLRAGGGVERIEELSGNPGAGQAFGKDIAIELPLTVAEAVAAGWKDPIFCRSGRGRYFRKDPAEGEVEPYFLLYNHLDRLIGIYQFSDIEMPPPWEQMDSLRGGGGLNLIDFEHWGLFVYFQDSIRACKTTEASEGRSGASSQTISGGDHIELGSAVKSTPTPVVPPTPTPSAGQVLEAVVARTARANSLSFTLTGDPESRKVEGTLDRKGALTLVKEGVVMVTDSAGTTQVLDASSLPFSFQSLGATLSSIAGALQEPVDTKAAFIDNLRRRGVTGTVLGSDLSALVPTAVADARVTVSLWFDDKGRIRRLQIEGAVTPNDPPDTVRVLDVGDY